jgi:predicted Ser/Thr protein kinase
VLLLHGPVGSSKSTIARLLKKGLEQYSRTDDGMLFAFSWRGENGAWHRCPMHKEPLHLVPHELRTPLLARLKDHHKSTQHDVTIQGELCPYIGALAIDGKRFDYKTNERLQKALELKLFEDQKDTIKLTSLVSSVVDKATQEKIDVGKSRLTRNYGYCDVCSTDVLSFVASIFARGHAKK